MKEVASFEQGIGGDGGKLKGNLAFEKTEATGVELVATVQARYPAEKLISKSTEAIDAALDKLEQAIPGTWDKPFIEKFKAEYKQSLLEKLAD